MTAKNTERKNSGTDIGPKDLNAQLRVLTQKDLLQKLMKGWYDEPNEFLEQLRTNGLEFASDNYLVWLIRFWTRKEDGTQTYFVNMEEITADLTTYLKSVLNAEELYCVCGELGIFCIQGTTSVGFTTSGMTENELRPIPNFVHMFVDATEKIIECFQDNFGKSVSIYQGRAHPGVLGVKQSYLDVVRMCKYCDLMDIFPRNICYLDFELMQDSSKNLGRTVLNLTKNYINCIESKNYTEAYNIINEIVDVEFIQNKPSIEIVRMRLAAVTNLLMCTMETLSDESDIEFFEDMYKTVASIDIQNITIPIFRQNIRKIFDAIAGKVSDLELDTGPAWLFSLLKFVQDNYTDPGLNVASIADNFGLSAAYVSNTVKKTLGVGLHEQIQKYRIDHAKKLFRITADISFIAKASGFSDVRAMRRTFKKYEGITPSLFSRTVGSDND